MEFGLHVDCEWNPHGAIYDHKASVCPYGGEAILGVCVLGTDWTQHSLTKCDISHHNETRARQGERVTGTVLVLALDELVGGGGGQESVELSTLLEGT